MHPDFSAAKIEKKKSAQITRAKIRYFRFARTVDVIQFYRIFNSTWIPKLKFVEVNINRDTEL